MKGLLFGDTNLPTEPRQVASSCVHWKAGSSGVTLCPDIAFLPKVLSPDHMNMVLDLETFYLPPYAFAEDTRVNLLCPVRAL